MFKIRADLQNSPHGLNNDAVTCSDWSLSTYLMTIDHITVYIDLITLYIEIPHFENTTVYFVPFMYIRYQYFIL